MDGYMFGLILGSLIVPAIGTVIIYNTSGRKAFAAVGFCVSATLALLPIFNQEIEKLYTFTAMLVFIGGVIAIGIKIKSINERVGADEVNVKQSPVSNIDVEENKIGDEMKNDVTTEIFRTDDYQTRTSLAVTEPDSRDYLFCIKCGIKNQKNHEFCFNCGTKLRIPSGVEK
jgi:hypothetical protein